MDDGEMPHLTLGIAQVDNAVLETTIRLLGERGVTARIYGADRGSYQRIYQIQIGTRRDILRFLGECRPRRILSKLNINMLGSLRPTQSVRVICNEPIGARLISSLATSTKTYIAEGFAAHNTRAEWQFICKIPFPPPSAILKARTDEDREYPYYLAWNKLTQIFGRIMRDTQDRGESFICDMHLDWFMRYSYLAPKSTRNDQTMND